MLVVGLDNSGKSTILNHFMPEEQKRPDIVPTVGFNVEKFKSRALTDWLFALLSARIARYATSCVDFSFEILHLTDLAPLWLCNIAIASATNSVWISPPCTEWGRGNRLR